MKWIRKRFQKYLSKKGYKKYNRAELQMILISTEICEQYIKSRKFRRTMDDLNIGKSIKNVLANWDDK